MLAGRQYRRRIVLLYGRADAQQLLLHQQQTLNAAQAELDERQMDVIILHSSELSEADRQILIHQPFGLHPPHDFRGWLIGKDGGVKHQFDQPIDPQALFRLVDTMPMRRQEMKHQ
jgi:Domain of unknown function (DUF4174)